MMHILLFSSLWLLIATLAVMISHWLKLAGAVSEILMGALLGFILTKYFGYHVLNPHENWIKFIGTAGAIFLTFLAGVELHPVHLKNHWKETSLIGTASFIVPFIICSLSIYALFHWTIQASLIAGISLSTTSVAVIYIVLLELNMNNAEYGKKLLISCFVTDLITVLVLTFMFTSYNYQSLIFILVLLVVLVILPRIVKYTFDIFGQNSNEFETKLLLFVLFGMSAFASYVKIEVVLPAYLIGVVLAKTLGRNADLLARLRTLTFGLLTPFYFISIGLLVDLSSLKSAGIIIIVLLVFKIISKTIAIYPLSIFFKNNKIESIYSVLLMSTGLTFGSIAALFGLTHGILTSIQYSILIAVVVGSAIFPIIVAYSFFKINSKKKIALK